MSWISKLLTLWIAIAIVIGLVLGNFFPEFSYTLEVGIPIGLFFMIYPAMTKIEIGELKKAFKSPKQTSVIVFFNYLVNLFLLFGLGYLFFIVVFPSLGLIDLATAQYLWTFNFAWFGAMHCHGASLDRSLQRK